jgi:CarboxypepD_reg-like domain
VIKNTFILLTLLLTLNSVAGNPVTGIIYVSGSVTDHNTNESLAGVEVRVQGTDIVTYTDFNGNYFLPELKAGTYTLEFKYPTYSQTSVVATGDQRDNQLNVELLPR